MKNILKFYEFDNKIKGYTVIDNIFAFIGLPFAPLIFYCFIKMIILDGFFGEDFIPSILNRIFLLISFVLGIVWLVIYRTSLKGIYMYNDHLQIERNEFSKYHPFSFNPKIKYEDIQSCTIHPKKSRNYKEWNEKQMYFVGGSADEYVRLETIHGKIYCFCIEKQDEFVDEINKLI